MIQTLRITGVAAVAFAGVVLASVLGPVSLIQYGGTGDQRVGNALAASGAVDRFQKMHAGKNLDGVDTTPPLVKQAQIFKEIIDPRQPVAAPVTSRTPTTIRKPGPVVKPPVTSTKFTLLGTCYSPSDPKSSFAYIQILGENTYQWVQCGSEVGGHLVVKEIKPDSVVCWDGSRENEVFMEAIPERTSLMETDGSEPAASASAATTTTPPAEAQVTGRPTSPSRPVMPRPGKSSNEAMGDLVERLKMMNNSRSGPNNPAIEAERVAAVTRLISELQSSRVSPQETKQLENLEDDEPNDGTRPTDGRMQEIIKRLNADRAAKD